MNTTVNVEIGKRYQNGDGTEFVVKSIYVKIVLREVRANIVVVMDDDDEWTYQVGYDDQELRSWRLAE